MDRDPDILFIESIRNLARSLEQDQHTDILQDQFFKFAESRNTLPDGCSDSIIEAFLASLISIITLKQNTKYVIKSVSLLTDYVKNGIFQQKQFYLIIIEARVFTKFKPNKPLLRKMNMSVHIISQNQQESDITLELCSVFLRYHRFLDYGDFSDNPYVVQRLRRYEDFKCWGEIEDLGSQNDKINKEFIEYKMTSENALQEILQHLEKIAQECPTKEEVFKELDMFKDRVYSDIDQMIVQMNQNQNQNQNIRTPPQQFKQDTNALDQSQYKRLLELMLDLERKVQSRIDTISNDYQKNISLAQDNREYKLDYLNQLNSKIENLEFNFQNKFLSKYELLERTQDQLLQNQSLLDNRMNIEDQKGIKVEETLRDQIELIQALNNKLVLQEETLKDTKNYFLNQQTRLEKEIIQKAFGEESSFKYDFTAHEETLKKIEDEIEIIQNDMILFKERTEKQLTENIQLTKYTRNEYIIKIKEIYEENNRMVKETKEVIDIIKSKHQDAIMLLDKKQQTALSKISEIELDFKTQIDRNIRELEQSALRQQKDISDNKDYFKKLRNEVIDLGTHIGQEISKILTSTNQSLSDQTTKQQDFETNIRRQVEEIQLKMGFYEKDFQNIGDNFNKLNEGQNKLLFSITTNNSEIQRNKKDINDTNAQMKKMEDFFNNNNKLNQMIDEANKLWVFFQKFIDEHAVDKIRIIRSRDTTITDKINTLEWLSRYAEFVTPDQINNVVIAFKDIYSGSDVQLRDNYISHRHNSEAIPTTIQILRNLRSKKGNIDYDDETFDQNMSLILCILEPLIINDQNLETLIKINAVKDFLDLTQDQQLPSENGEQNENYQQNFKFAIRCITSCLRIEQGVAAVMQSDIYFKRIMRILEEYQEEEVVANASKILRLVLRHDGYYDTLAAQYPKLGNFILLLMNKHYYSQAIIQETTAALRNFTRKPAYVGSITPSELKIVVKLARDQKFERIKSVALQAIKNISKLSDYEKHFKFLGASDLLIQANIANNIGNQLQNQRGSQQLNTSLSSLQKK